MALKLHYQNLVKATMPTHPELASYFQMLAFNHEPQPSGQVQKKGFELTCSCCGNAFLSGTFRSRLKPKSRIGRSVKKYLKQACWKGERRLSSFGKKTIAYYLKKRNKLVTTCGQCQHQVKILGWSRERSILTDNRRTTSVETHRDVNHAASRRRRRRDSPPRHAATPTPSRGTPAASRTPDSSSSPSIAKSQSCYTNLAAETDSLEDVRQPAPPQRPSFRVHYGAIKKSTTSYELTTVKARAAEGSQESLDVSMKTPLLKCNEASSEEATPMRRFPKSMSTPVALAKSLLMSRSSSSKSAGQRTTMATTTTMMKTTTSTTSRMPWTPRTPSLEGASTGASASNASVAGSGGSGYRARARNKHQLLQRMLQQSQQQQQLGGQSLRDFLSEI